MSEITVKETTIRVVKIRGEDYLCLTDMIKEKDGGFFVADWLRNRNTIEFLGIWEKVYNPNFNCGEFDIIKSQAGLNRFRISVADWVAKTNAVGIISRTGRYGGTYAHKDLAFEFGMWISPEFKIYLIKEFERLKSEEQKQLGWSAKRELAKINYHIHTDAIKQNLIPAVLDGKKTSVVYASEADVLNVAMFGMTAQEWRNANPDKKGNLRDYATVAELICLANLESLNSIYINEQIPQSERLVKLNFIAISQMRILAGVPGKRLFSETAKESVAKTDKK